MPLHVYEDCRSLASITIPDSVTSIGDESFYGCNALQYKVKNNIKYLGNANHPYVVVIGVTDKTLTSYTIENSVKVICNSAFENCSSLTSVVIPDSVTCIGYKAFFGCESLTSINIPNSVTSIDKYAFWGCTSLTNVAFKNTSGWTAGDTSLSSSDLANSSTAAKYLNSTYEDCSWKRS